MGRSVQLIYRTKLFSASEYATADDFQRLFASEMEDLFRLALCLTADADRAERCLITTMRECMANGSVFKRWLPVWTRNAVIENAVRSVTGHPVCPIRKTKQRLVRSLIHKSARYARSDSDESAGIFELSDFDRIVYVLCVLERFRARDCATLLGKSRQEVRDAQCRALAQVDAFEKKLRYAPRSLCGDICSSTQ
jgi:DNA-directed RNA polymerase specialized sigma24 family protein